MPAQKTQLNGKARFLEPTTALQWDRQRRVLDAISLKRRNPELSLSKAAKQSGTTLRTVRRYAGPTLYTRSGRLDVRDVDRISRDMRFLTPKGQIVVRVRSSRDASRISRYNNAIRKYVLYHDDRPLKKFVGKSLTIGKSEYPFVTDQTTIIRLLRAGEVHFMDIYASPGGEL